MKLLHMVTASPARTPSLTMFGDENYFFVNANGGACATQSACVFVGPNFAWNHGDFQKDITRTWVAMVGPGVRKLGRNDELFTDHADVRPTIMALLGLQDDYVHEGRVIAEWMQEQALPQGIRKGTEDFTELARVFKQLNAPLGRLGRASLVWANRSVTGNDKVYASYLKRIAEITDERNKLAGQMKTALNDAAFHNKAVGEFSEIDLTIRGKLLIDQVEDLAGRD
jgi:arylsulfatase A-like enzyme